MTDGREDAPSEAPAARRAQARRRSPLVAFLIGVAVIGVVAALTYLFWPDAAETPATAEEAAITDEALGLPAPDAGSIQQQVDQALRAPPSEGAGRAEQAAASAQAQTAPEAEDAPAPAPAEPPPTAPETTSPVPSPETR